MPLAIKASTSKHAKKISKQDAYHASMEHSIKNAASTHTLKSRAARVYHQLSKQVLARMQEKDIQTRRLSRQHGTQHKKTQHLHTLLKSGTHAYTISYQSKY